MGHVLSEPVIGPVIGVAVLAVPDVSTRGCSHYCKSAQLFSHHLLLYETLGQWEMSGKTDMSTESCVTMIQGEGKQSSSFIQK